MKTLVCFCFILFQCKYLPAVNIGLLIMGNGSKPNQVHRLIESAKKNFCKGHSVTFYVFSDEPIETQNHVIHIFQNLLKYPYDKLLKNYIFYINHLYFAHEDYVFSVDPSVHFVDEIGDEVLGETVGAIDARFATTGLSFPYEKHPDSRAYVAQKEMNLNYFSGAFYGGDFNHFMEILLKSMTQVMEDLSKGIIANSNDESHWNRICLDEPPSVILPLSYAGYSMDKLDIPTELIDIFNSFYPQKHLVYDSTDK